MSLSKLRGPLKDRKPGMLQFWLQKKLVMTQDWAATIFLDLCVLRTRSFPPPSLTFPMSRLLTNYWSEIHSDEVKHACITKELLTFQFIIIQQNLVSLNYTSSNHLHYLNFTAKVPLVCLLNKMQVSPWEFLISTLECRSASSCSTVIVQKQFFLSATTIHQWGEKNELLVN